jgi:hypothetical protein
MDWSFSRICIWESDVEVGDITCNIVDNVKDSRRTCASHPKGAPPPLEVGQG